MGDRLGIPGAVSFCFSFTGQLTHFSKLQHSCVLLYPFNLIAASFCLLTSLWLLSAFGVTKDSSASSFFISPPGGDRQAFFWQLRGRCTLLDFKFKFQEFNDKQILKFKFSDVGDWSKITCKWTNQIFSFFSYFFGTWKTGQEIHQLKKIQWNNHKGKSKYLFIYLLFFLGMAFLFFL